MDLYQASMEQEEVEEIALTKEEYDEAVKYYEAIIANGEAALRLANNEDFKKLILEGYLSNEPKRLADLMASGRLNNQVFESCSEQIQSVAHFRNYMKVFTDQGGLAKEELISLEQAYNEALEAGAAG